MISVIRTLQTSYGVPQANKVYAAKIRLQNFFGFRLILVINTHFHSIFANRKRSFACRAVYGFFFIFLYELEMCS